MDEKNKNGGIKNFFKKFSKDAGVFTSDKLKKVLIIISVVIIALIFFSSFITNDSVEKTTKEDNVRLSAEEYCVSIQNRLVNVLGSVKGIGKVEALVMVDSSPTIKYLEETTSTINEASENKTQTVQTTIVLAKNGTITNPVVVVELMPKITGVLIVATGAKDLKMKTMLINVVSSVLSVDISKVEVLEGKA